MPPQYYIGTSGWHYDHWRSLFYPDKLAKAEWLSFYSSHFNSVELNNTFYRLPSENAFSNWYDSSPAGFVFSVKASRYITHIKRLKDKQSIDTFLDRAKGLKEKLGPLLYQLPPNMLRNDERLESFLSFLPREKLHAFEFRHPSWFEDGVFKILRKHNAGFCVFDMPDLTTPLVATADFAYIRFHGNVWLYGSRYSDEEMADWAKKLSALAASSTLKALYVYFNNDAEAFAIENARTLSSLLEVK